MAFSPVHFLLVDDLEENLTALEALLRREGLVILKARSGPEALELLLQHDIALALVDVQMPGMDGFELAEFMRGKERTKGVPIIFLTAGSADKQRRFRGYEAGAVDFLQKPVDTDIIKSKADVFYELYRRRLEVAHQRDELEIATQEAKKYSAALKEADQRKDEFLATLAHELRNPLAPIRNGLEILRVHPVGEKSEEVRVMIDRQLSHMVRLIDDLLDMSRISKGKIYLRKERMNLNDAVGSALESARPHIDNNGHALTVDVPEKPIWIDGDLTRVSQIIGNLLNNAARYTPPGGEIKLTARAEKGQAVIKVSDNGIGIPRDSIEKIFDLFTQVNIDTQEAQNGLGIGLALSRHLVHLHGGAIQAESDGSGKGSAFIVRFPLSDVPAQENTKKSNAKTDEIPQKFKILVVDDNVDSAQTTGWMLEMCGHEYILAHNGKDALSSAKNIKPDVVLLDIGLPDITGYEVCRALRLDPQFQDTLIIAQTGWGQKRDKQLAEEAGFNHHLVKPLKLEELNNIFSLKKDV
jgi:signal transduction histidine kinase